MWDAFLAIIPRALWPNKPVTAGSGNLVSDYTGIHFVEGTSVGIGQVMESYINFGTEGVWVAFLLIGLVISLVDQNAADLIAGPGRGSFLMWYLPGQAILQVGGSFAEVTSTAAAGIVMAFVLGRVVRRAAGSAEPPSDFRPERSPVVMPRPCLSAITLDPKGGGVAAVSRLLRDVMKDAWGL